jgi:hypothetical protein
MFSDPLELITDDIPLAMTAPNIDESEITAFWIRIYWTA